MVTILRSTTLKKGLMLETVKLAEKYYRTVLVDKYGQHVPWPDGREFSQHDNYIDAIVEHEEVARKLLKTF